MKEILLVEDDPGDVELMLHALRNGNTSGRVHVARDGEEALEFLYGGKAGKDHCANSRLELILLDLKLPKVDGLTVLREIKSDAFLKAIPVVVMTSSGEENDLVQSYRLGANSYVQKPVDFEQFCEVVKQLELYWLLVNVPPPAKAFAQPEPGRTR